MEGKQITAAELKARWAYAEISEDRWRESYADLSPEKVRQGAPFDDLRSDEKAHLVWMLSVQREGMAPALDRFATYQCEAGPGSGWPKPSRSRT